MVHHAVPGAIALLIFGIVWLLFTSGLVFQLVRDPNISFVKFSSLLFPLIGLLMVYGGLRALSNALRYGNPTLILTDVPQNIGKRFSASLQMHHIPKGAIHASLTCAQKRTGKHSRETILWKDEREIPAASIRQTSDGYSIPLDFQLPPTAPQTQTLADHEAIVWTARVAIGHRNGGLVDARFEIPVFGAA